MRSEGVGRSENVQGEQVHTRRFRSCTIHFRDGQCGTLIIRQVAFTPFYPRTCTQHRVSLLMIPTSYDPFNNNIIMPPRSVLPQCKLFDSPCESLSANPQP